MHHECYDGSGFPKGLKGDEVPSGYILSTIEACEEMHMQGLLRRTDLSRAGNPAGKSSTLKSLPPTTTSSLRKPKPLKQRPRSSVLPFV